MTLNKINCPICCEEIDETHHGTDLGIHLYWQHKPKDPEHDAGDVYRYYSVLIFKIHEKIEWYESFKSTEYNSDKLVIQELKSLLEDNHK